MLENLDVHTALGKPWRLSTAELGMLNRLTPTCRGDNSLGLQVRLCQLGGAPTQFCQLSGGPACYPASSAARLHSSASSAAAQRAILTARRGAQKCWADPAVMMCMRADGYVFHCPVRAHTGRLSAVSVFRRESVWYGVFV
jgi:hypothetical protein